MALLIASLCGFVCFRKDIEIRFCRLRHSAVKCSTLLTENPLATFERMSSVAFISQSSEKEVEKLREAFQALNDCLRGLSQAEACIEILNFGLAKDHLKAAKWHANEAKKAIGVIGQSKNQKASS